MDYNFKSDLITTYLLVAKTWSWYWWDNVPVDEAARDKEDKQPAKKWQEEHITYYRICTHILWLNDSYDVVA